MLQTADSNETVTVPTEDTRNVNIYHATQVTISKDPNGETTVQVSWQRGYNEGDTFIPVEGGDVELTQADFGSHAQAAVVDGQSRYGAFKDLLWASLQAEGTVPAGTIS